MRVLIANPSFRIPLEGDEERHFIVAGCRFPCSIRKKKTAPPRFAMFPFFLAYTAGLLERDGFEVKVIDGVPLNLSREDFISHAVATRPDVILFEPATPTIDWVCGVARDLAAQTSAKIVLAGPHVTVFPQELLREYSHIDFVMIGEYEMAFLELARRLRNGSSCTGLRGVAFRTADGQFAGGERAPEIDPIDQLPPPARHLFPSFFSRDLSLYHDGFCQHRPAIQLHSSRGCPFRCNFCLLVQVLFNAGRHRCFSPDRIVDEMIEARDRYGAREIYFDDDDFTVRKEHVFSLCDEIERRQVDIPWSVMGDAMATDEETLLRMSRAGCIGMKFGLESADPVVLKRTGKPIKLDRVVHVANVARRLGIKTHMTVTFGLPGETYESLERTFTFACQLDIDSIQFSIATPYPGTRFYEEVKQAGRLRFDRWEDFDGLTNAIYECEAIDRQFLERFEATAHGRWLRHKMRDPKWLYRQVRQLYRLGRGQGVSGLWNRVVRGYRLLRERQPATSFVNVERPALRMTKPRP